MPDLRDTQAKFIAMTISNACDECFNETQFMDFCRERLDEDEMKVVKKFATLLKEAA